LRDLLRSALDPRDRRGDPHRRDAPHARPAGSGRGAARARVRGGCMTAAPAAAAGRVALGKAESVSRLGFGAMRITGRGIMGEPDDPDEARRVLRRAVELGVELIDTAHAYGPERSERLVGEAPAPSPPALMVATTTRSRP